MLTAEMTRERPARPGVCKAASLGACFSPHPLGRDSREKTGVSSVARHRTRSVILGFVCGVSLLSGALGCGGGALTQRFADEPVGISHELGAPKNTAYSAELETEKDVLRLIVFEQSECERIRVRIVSRTEETLRGGEVVQRQPVGPVQIADGSDGVVACEQRYARDVRVSLQVGTATHRLGRTNPKGELAINLSAELRQSLYGETAPESAMLLVEGREVTQVPLGELRKHEERVDQLVSMFEAILAKPNDQLTPTEITHSYELYEQLRHLDRGDARIAALHARFLELLYGRKEEEASQNLKRNLAALREVKELIATGATGVPMFVQIAAQAGALDPAALRWAKGQIALSLRSHQSACQGGFSWSTLSSGEWPSDARFAFAYLRYAYDDPFQDQVAALCGRL
jgi:hypothetical protein